MRKIKFRAWDEDEKIMRNVSCIFWNTLGWYISRFELDGKDMKTGMPIMQYTGLKDKNGKEIFEEDVLSGDFPDVVFWDDDRGQWRLRNSENPDDTLWEILRDNNPEIIGNIYENPELLESKKEAK